MTLRVSHPCIVAVFVVQVEWGSEDLGYEDAKRSQERERRDERFLHRQPK